MEGNELVENLNYSLGTASYLKSWEKSPQPETARGLAQAYFKMRDFLQAEAWYGRLQREGALKEEDKLNFAEVLIGNSKYTEASNLLNSMQSKGSPDWELLMNTAMHAREKLNQPSNYQIQPLENINSSFSDFAPQFSSANKLLFVSDRTGNSTGFVDKKNSLNSEIYGWTGNGYLKVYEVDWISETEQGEVKENLEFVNRLHIGPVFTSDFMQFATITETQKFRKNSSKSSKRDYTLFPEIYFKSPSDSIEEFQKLPFNSPFQFSVSDPFFDEETKRLYFSSDMPGGFGGSDIYYSELIGEENWTEPVNLGSKINTKGDERTPYQDEDGTFYFASNGWNGIGGLDIYLSENKEASFGDPVNLGSPINSNRDDFGFIKSRTEEKFVLLASDRAGGKGLDDIYMGMLIEEVQMKLKGKVFDKSTGAVLENAVVTLNDENNNILGTYVTDYDGAFEFTVQPESVLDLQAKMTGFISETIAEIEIGEGNTPSDSVTYQDIYLEKIAVGKTYTLENIYYDFDKWDIRSDAEPELVKLAEKLKENPTMKIDLYSHTDSRGNDAYNMKLSEKRANAVVDFLVQLGISKERLRPEGFGESKLLNNCKNGIECTEEEHQLNRRTEFKITAF